MPSFLKVQISAQATTGSLVHSFDPRLKILMIGILSVAVWQVDSLAGLAIVVLWLAGWVALLRNRARSILNNLKILIYLTFLAGLYYGWAELAGPANTLGEALKSILINTTLLVGKLAVLIAASYWIYLSTAPLKVVDALCSLLKPLEKIRLPVREFAFIVGLVVRFFPESVERISDLYRTLQLREKLIHRSDLVRNRYRRAAERVIDTMVLYMHYSLHEAELLALSLMSRGYNPFRPVRMTTGQNLSFWEIAVFILSSGVIVSTAWWL